MVSDRKNTVKSLLKFVVAIYVSMNCFYLFCILVKIFISIYCLLAINVGINNSRNLICYSVSKELHSKQYNLIKDYCVDIIRFPYSFLVDNKTHHSHSLFISIYYQFVKLLPYHMHGSPQHKKSLMRLPLLLLKWNIPYF